MKTVSPSPSPDRSIRWWAPRRRATPRRWPPRGRKVEEVLSGAHVSLVDGAILAAVNIADEYFKEVEAAENLRRQLKEYLEEATKMKLELSEAKREIFKLQNKK